MSDHSNADEDAQVRASLAEYGDDGRVPRLTEFYFYDGDFAGLTTAASAAGYQVRNTAANDGIVLETTTPVDEANFKAHSARMLAWAEEFSCKYDGWECDVVTQ